MFKPNSLFYVDGYKTAHKAMLAPGTTRLYGTWIPRSTKHAPKGITKIVSFGQQLVWKWIHDEFEENFFGLREKHNSNKKAKQEALQFVKDMSVYLGMEYDGKHFEELWDLGYLPIKVKALPEGIETNPNIPHMTFVNTVDGFAWLTLYLETVVSSLAWKPSTAATIAKLYRRQAEEWVMKTDKDNIGLVDFMCHDFSARGTDPMSMYLFGLGHATSFKGSDSLIVIPASRYFYGVKEDEMPIFSVNASEHSVSTTKIFTVGEEQMIIDWLQIFQEGILSMVCDTFSTWQFIEYLKNPKIKELVLSRKGKLVIRPDSGDPVDIICGLNIPEFNNESEIRDCFYNIDENKEFIFKYKEQFYIVNSDYTIEEHIREYGQEHWNEWKTLYDAVEKYGYVNTYKPKFSTSEQKGVIELLWDIFGGTINEQGYKVLDPHIGAIYGDSITPERQKQIYERLAAKGFAATNIVLGVGSYTYQMNTRDTLGFAAKGAWFEVNENGKKVGYGIYKDPITDSGEKKSLKGLCAVLDDGLGNIFVKTECTPEQEEKGLLKTIYENGKFYNQTTLSKIRKRINQNI